MPDCTYDRDVAVGERGRRAKLVQEWLCLNGLSVAVDGKFGPATAAAVRQFQERSGLKATGVVDEETFTRLVAPMLNALEPLAPDNSSLGAMAVAYAKQHLAQAPREVGGQNRGPWVRLYMKGNEGPEWPWCAGFASFVLQQAADTLGRPLPFATSFSCDLIAASAKAKACFCAGARAAMPSQVTPGSLFLTRRTVGDWVHTGIVVRAEPEVFVSIEGNTNDAGDREGYEVCQRLRGYAGKDFVLVDT